jgi:hypothetical protein
MLPEWYGHRYPTYEDLESFVWTLGAIVMPSPLDISTFTPSLYKGMVPVLGIPSIFGELEKTWSLAHEIGHLTQHSGPKGELFYSKGEFQANRWAACALIPKSRIFVHGNACQDAFIAALSAHFEDLPLADCPQRRLAAKIANIRLRILGDANRRRNTWTPEFVSNE